MKVFTGALPVLLAVLPLTVVIAAVQRKDHREWLLPGPTSPGHRQIEERCELCHDAWKGVDEQRCQRCHGAALAQQNDSHAADKFLDPVRAQMLGHVDARSCVACHREHRPEARSPGGVSVARDFCFGCHTDIGQQRASHRDFAPTSCADRGCHNYHDNRAFDRKLLALDHAGRAPAVESPAADGRSRVLPLTSPLPARGPALVGAEADLLRRWDDPAEVPSGFARWTQSSHARGGVNCSGCHGSSGPAVPKNSLPNAASWTVAVATCGSCHGDELAGFHAGKHGMRSAAGLPPLRPTGSALPMKTKARADDRPIDCGSCHRAHDFDRTQAAVEACEGCHDDPHTRAYRGSPHFDLLTAERAGRLPVGAGVSCASCHLPRRTLGQGDTRRVVAGHNQSENLRPGDRMARDVCLPCHSLGYALDALSDVALVTRNFTGPPGPRPSVPPQ